MGTERAGQRDFFAQFDRPAASIVVATSKPQKDWLPERWAEVVDALWHDFGLQPVLVGGRSPRELHAEQIIARARAPQAALRARQRPAQPRGNSRRVRARARAGHRSAAHGRRARSPGGLPHGLHESQAHGTVSQISRPHRRRVRRSRRSLSGEMENRLDRMPRITVRDVLDRVERWRTSYASARTGPKS